MKNDALTMNLSVVNNDGELEGGIHITASDGLDVSSKFTGDSVDELCENIITDIMAQVDDFYAEDDEDEYDDDAYDYLLELEEDNLKLKEEVKALKEQVAKLSSKKYNYSSLDSSYDKYFNVSRYFDDIVKALKDNSRY